MVDLTPGFNLSHKGIIPYFAASGTKTVLGAGTAKAVTPTFSTQNGKLVVGSSNPSYGSTTAASIAAPASAPSTKNDTTNGTVKADPYAAFGGTTAYNNLRNGYTDQKNSLIGSADRSADTSALGRKNSILDFLDSLRSQQQSIDNTGVVNERTRLQGMDDVSASVQGGVRNANSLLAGRNAGGASVGDEIAKYLQGQGRQQASQVNNDYDTAQIDLQNQQSALNTSRDSGLRGLDADKQNSINSIVDSAESGLAQINSAMASASLPDRIALQDEKNSILQRVTQKLSQYDQMLSEGANGVQGQDVATRRVSAENQRQAGTAAYDDSAYDFGAAQATPQTTQSDLPLFTYSFRRRGA